MDGNNLHLTRISRINVNALMADILYCKLLLTKIYLHSLLFLTEMLDLLYGYKTLPCSCEYSEQNKSINKKKMDEIIGSAL